MKAPKLFGFPLWNKRKKKRQAATFLRKWKKDFGKYEGIRQLLDCRYNLIDIEDSDLEIGLEYNRSGFLYDITFFKQLDKGDLTNCSLKQCCMPVNDETMKFLFQRYKIDKELSTLEVDLVLIRYASEKWMKEQGYR